MPRHEPRASAGDRKVQAGAIAIAGNDYPGADAIQGMVVPYINATWRDKYFIDPIRGIGVQLGGGRQAATRLKQASPGISGGMRMTVLPCGGWAISTAVRPFVSPGATVWVMSPSARR